MSGSSPRLRLLADDPSPCAGCHGRCCAEHPVNVDGFDLVRLMRAHAAPWQELVELTAVRHPLYFGFRLDRSAEHWMMWLRKKPDGACRFLVDEARRCGSYASRPGACRVYPFALGDGRPMLSEHAICPAERAAAFGARASEDQTVLADLAERERYARALSRWDLAVRGEPLRVDDFVAWIGALVDALATVDQAAAPSLIDSFALPVRRHAG